MMMMMMIMITSPGRLIQKRTDKLLDFSSASQRAEKNRDATKNRLVIVIIIIIVFIVFIGVITVIIIVITIIIIIMSCGVPTPLNPLDRANCGFQINPISLSLSCCHFNPSQVF